MAPLHHHFEALGWKESKIIARFWIAGLVHGAVRADDAEAEIDMEPRGPRRWWSGCRSRASRRRSFSRRDGAVVRATDLKPLEQLPQAREVLERLGIPFAQQSPAVFEGCDLVVISPDVPADLPILKRERADSRDRRGGTGRPVSQGTDHRDHRLERQDHDDGLIGHILREAGVPVQVGGNIGTAGLRDGRVVAGRRLERAGTFELPARDHLEFRAHIGLA